MAPRKIAAVLSWRVSIARYCSSCAKMNRAEVPEALGQIAPRDAGTVAHRLAVAGSRRSDRPGSLPPDEGRCAGSGIAASAGRRGSTRPSERRRPLSRRIRVDRRITHSAYCSRAGRTGAIEAAMCRPGDTRGPQGDGRSAFEHQRHTLATAAREVRAPGLEPGNLAGDGQSGQQARDHRVPGVLLIGQVIELQRVSRDDPERGVPADRQTSSGESAVR